ncbi:hypothetical protein J4227_04760 [Candidatus Woesearchaeota archaeon]|nr:hypothetical protein [Candidatus Woesearchaeota archaeon]
MGLKKQVADYWVELVASAVFLLSVYRIVVILYSRPLGELWTSFGIAVISLLLMNYKNLGHHITGKSLKRPG